MARRLADAVERLRRTSSEAAERLEQELLRYSAEEAAGREGCSFDANEINIDFDDGQVEPPAQGDDGGGPKETAKLDLSACSVGGQGGGGGGGGGRGGGGGEGGGGGGNEIGGGARQHHAAVEIVIDPNEIDLDDDLEE